MAEDACLDGSFAMHKEQTQKGCHQLSCALIRYLPGPMAPAALMHTEQPGTNDFRELNMKQQDEPQDSL